MFREAPPSRADVTTSRTCADSVDVKILTNSGNDRARQRPARDDGGQLPPERAVPEVRDQEVGGDVRDHHRHARRQPHEGRERRLEVHLPGAGVAAPGDRLVDQVGRAAGHDHQDAHREDPDQELDLDRRVLHREQDEGDQRDPGHPVGLEAVGGRADRVAGVVARAVGDDARVAGIVLLDVEHDLHEVRADVRDLREDAAGDPEGRRAEGLPDREADEARPGVLAGDEQEDAQHQEELHADEEHPDAHPGLERDRVDRQRPPREAGERRPRVREGVDPHAEPGDAVAPADADEAEQENDHDPHGLEPEEDAEVEDDDEPDEDLEDQDELALRHQIRLARLVDQLRDLPHGRVHGQVLDAPEDDEPEDQPQDAHDQPAEEERPPVHAHERDRPDIGHAQAGLAPAGVRRGGRRRRGRGLGEARDRRHQGDQQDGEQTEGQQRRREAAAGRTAHRVHVEVSWGERMSYGSAVDRRTV